MFAFRLIALLSGILFGLGMAISGMVLPERVIGFLDVAGDWNPSLIFVMGGALMVFAPVYWLYIKKQDKPVLASSFSLSSYTRIDKRLIMGAAIFGLGWGLVGICPGPVVSSLTSLSSGVWLFFASMMVGLGATNLFLCRCDQVAQKSPVKS